MDKLAKHQWYLYQIFIVLAILGHMGLMAWYTYESQTSVQDLNGTLPNRDSIDLKSSDFLMMLYAGVIRFGSLAAIVFSKIQQRITGDVKAYQESETFSDYVEAEGALLNSHSCSGICC